MPTPAARKARRQARHRQLHEAVRFAMPQRHAILAIILLTLGVAAINACEPLILKWIFDSLTAAASLQLLFIGIGLLGVLALMRESMDGVANWLTWRTRIGLQYAMLEATIGKLHRMPLAVQRSEGIGAIMTRLDGLTSARPRCCLRSSKARSAAIGVVLQDPLLLFNDTVCANIAYGRPDASMADIENAAKAAYAHGFILRLPEEYNTKVGERGGILSGGERQRITIARAIKEPAHPGAGRADLRARYRSPNRPCRTRSNI